MAPSLKLNYAFLNVTGHFEISRESDPVTDRERGSRRGCAECEARARSVTCDVQCRSRGEEVAIFRCGSQSEAPRGRSLGST